MFNLILIILLSLSFSNDVKIENTKTDTLPQNMPLIKKVFWGESGI